MPYAVFSKVLDDAGFGSYIWETLNGRPVECTVVFRTLAEVFQAFMDSEDFCTYFEYRGEVARPLVQGKPASVENMNAYLNRRMRKLDFAIERIYRLAQKPDSVN